MRSRIFSFSIQTTTVPLRHVGWYKCCWIAEDSHQCLNTGCQIEERQAQSVERLLRLSLLSPLAVRRLARAGSLRRTPERPAQEGIEHDVLAATAACTGQVHEGVTIAIFWKTVARLGGYVGRRGDGPPGWQALWKGWICVQTLPKDVHLAFYLRL